MAMRRLMDDLGTYKAEGRFLDGYPDDQETFFAPRDNCGCWSLLGTAGTPSWSTCSARRRRTEHDHQGNWPTAGLE
jgi:hypothetical protein